MRGCDITTKKLGKYENLSNKAGIANKYHFASFFFIGYPVYSYCNGKLKASENSFSCLLFSPGYIYLEKICNRNYNLEIN